jgi:diacylglycerol kinase family enzyme
MKVIVFLNHQSGITKPGGNSAGNGHDRTARVRAVLETAGVDAVVREVDPAQLESAAREALREPYDAVVAAGGDGTVSAVASALTCSGRPMGVLPMGTLNHFAKDLGLPLDLSAAAAVIARGQARRLDVGDVNGRVFINNSSIGLYPHIVRQRDREMERFGRSKWMAVLVATLRALRRFPTVRVRVSAEQQTHLCDTPFVFVGNNEYQIDRLELGRRAALDRGQLCLYFTTRTGRLGMTLLALRALFGRLKQAKDFDAMCVTEVWIDSPKKHLRVALDGEVIELTPPLHYRIRPGELRVLA